MFLFMVLTRSHDSGSLFDLDFNQRCSNLLWGSCWCFQGPLLVFQDILLLCWAFKPEERPSFSKLVDLLEKLPKRNRRLSHPGHFWKSAEYVKWVRDTETISLHTFSKMNPKAMSACVFRQSSSDSSLFGFLFSSVDLIPSFFDLVPGTSWNPWSPLRTGVLFWISVVHLMCVSVPHVWMVYLRFLRLLVMETALTWRCYLLSLHPSPPHKSNDLSFLTSDETLIKSLFLPDLLTCDQLAGSCFSQH